MSAQPQRGPLLVLKYNGAAPPPHPPCTDPTPDEMFEIEMANKAREMQAKESAQKEAPKDDSAMGKIGGFFSKAATAVDKAYNDGHDAAERKVRDWEKKQGDEKFTVNFPELVAAGDTFVTHYSVAVMHKGQQVNGTFFLSQRHIAFVSDTLKEAWALAAVASIQRSCALKTQDQGPPFIMPIPAPQVMPNCLQFFLTDMRVLQFLAFDNIASKTGEALTSSLKGRPIDRCYNWTDHVWRTATQVPVPGVQYATY